VSDIAMAAVEVLIADYAQMSENLGRQIAYLKDGNIVRPGAATDAQAAAAAIAWMRKYRSKYDSIIADLRRHTANV
jgi:hypothetical protein